MVRRNNSNSRPLWSLILSQKQKQQENRKKAEHLSLMATQTLLVQTMLLPQLSFKSSRLESSQFLQYNILSSSINTWATELRSVSHFVAAHDSIIQTYKYKHLAPRLSNPLSNSFPERQVNNSSSLSFGEQLIRGNQSISYFLNSNSNN